jgi:two-component system, chemotaxis family, protein-glutamate methylesterase/glutaminase
VTGAPHRARPDADAAAAATGRHAVVAIGASAGGVEALREVLAGLPGDLPAVVLVVLHVSPRAPSVLPRILGRRCALPVEHARDGEAIVPGRVYVAPPDVHLLVRGGRVHLLHGPRENGMRPAVDPLFRTVARAYGGRAIGVVLSGTLDDGTLGLARIKERGGRAVVQDPDEALFDGMPRNAATRVAVDHVAVLADIPALLARLAHDVTTNQGPTPMRDELESERDMEEIDGGARRNEALGGRLSGITCPECHGALWQMEDVGGTAHYRCRVGHAYAEESLDEAKATSIEAALWTALTALEEQAALTWRMARRAAADGHDARQRRYEERARMFESRARVLGTVLRDPALAGAGAGAGSLPHADTGAA